MFSRTHKKSFADGIDLIDELEAQNMISNTESEKRAALKADLTELEKKESTLLVPTCKKNYGLKKEMKIQHSYIEYALFN